MVLELIVTGAEEKGDLGLAGSILIEVVGRMVSLLLAGRNPLLPLVVGVEGGEDEDEQDEAEDEFHGWG